MAARIVALSTVCIAATVSLKVLFPDQHPVVSDPLPSGSREELSDALPDPAFDREEQIAQFGPSSSTTDLSWFEATKNRETTPRVSRERFNAALAAGLIDPSRIGILDALPPVVNPVRQHPLTFNGPGVSIQNPVGVPESQGPLVTETIAPLPSLAASPTKPIDPVSSLALAIDKPTLEPPARPDQARPLASRPSFPQRENDRSGQVSKNKSLPVRFAERAGIGSAASPDARETSSKRSSSPPGRTKIAISTDRKPGAQDSPAQHLSENFQRFASEFVRAKETGNFAEQNRFFADSVHFYGEGDLSLASVASATRRHHREQQTKRSEIAGPAIAKGPVNGGFFVIEQPVRWTQSQGTTVTKGRSVLQLRVLASDNGNWKITSIDEIKN
jgi:hypothetical protein